MGEVIRIAGFSASEGLLQLAKDIVDNDLDDSELIVITNDYVWYLGDYSEESEAIRDTIFNIELFKYQILGDYR